MIIIFDLDDTLYKEIDFVKGGMRAVSYFLEDHIRENSKSIYSELIHILHTEGRGKIFDKFLNGKRKFNKYLVARCINEYRFHSPNIKLYESAQKFLNANKFKSLYLVTDGNKNVQWSKIKALDLERFFKKIFITHRYGIKNAKPSLYCFEKIKTLEQADWKDLVYIGDNPAKDFVSLKKVHAKTIRVLTGNYANTLAPEKFDADYTINSLDKLDLLLDKIF
tara:strand:- start:1202 stop:1867 length:666 start_codon:yes stop_codon:yes gene_type:complete